MRKILFTIKSILYVIVCLAVGAILMLALIVMDNAPYQPLINKWENITGKNELIEKNEYMKFYLEDEYVALADDVIDHQHEVDAKMTSNIKHFLKIRGYDVVYTSFIPLGEEDVFSKANSLRSSNIIGKCCPYQRIILLRDDKPCYAHEVGHALQFTKSFDKIWTDAGIDIDYYEWQEINWHNVYSPEHIYSDMSEITAELYNEYLLYPEQLKANAPHIYEVYDTYICGL